MGMLTESGMHVYTLRWLPKDTVELEIMLQMVCTLHLVGECTSVDVNTSCRVQIWWIV